jgi:hypothetical protein
MKKFAIKAIAFLVILFVLVYSLQSVIDKVLKNSTFHNYKEWNAILYSHGNADIIIQGSSRACYHISPYILDSVFNLNSYNLGIDGYCFDMQYYRFLLYLKNNKRPKYIIQTVDHFTLDKGSEMFLYTQFLPYLDDDVIKKAVSSYNFFDWRDFYIPLYKYHSNYMIVMKGLINRYNKSFIDNGKYKGFLEHNNEWDSDFKSFKKRNPLGWRTKIDSGNQALFENFLNICKEKNIKIIFVYTPEYIEGQKLLINRDSIKSIFNNYSHEYGIPFLDYSDDAICLDTLNFYNSQHLNSRGVRKFNTKLANDLKIINEGLLIDRKPY